MKRYKVLAVLLCVALLSGCMKIPVEGTMEEKEQGADSFTSMEEEPVLSYEVPESVPGIQIDQLGYKPGATKIAVFTGSEMPEIFYVINADTGQIAYTGRTEEQGYKEELSEYNGYGDFSELKTEGTYYIEAPVLGRSYSFRIEDGIYDDIFKEACKQYYYNRCGITLTEEYAEKSAHNACHTGKAALLEDISISMEVTGGWHQDEKGQKNVVTASQTIAVMLLAYELYGEAFTDDMGIPESGNGVPDILDEIKYEIEWLFKMQDQKTGAVYAGVTVYSPGEDASGKASDIYVEPASAESEKAFAMVMAKFGYLYQNYDTAYATLCLKAADRAWKYSEMRETKSEKTDSLSFAAAAELYRAAGKRQFHQKITEYMQDTGDSWEKDEITLLGCVTYISTKHSVNKEICETIMDMLMSEAEDIAKVSRASLYFTAGNEKQDNNDKLLLDMMYLTVVNHIISNHEYETVIQNHLHYFLGVNPKAVSYIENAGERSYEDLGSSLGIMKQFEEDSKLIFMLSEIVTCDR